ncbi:FAD-binding protein [Chloroflexota bacterium]
MAIKVIVENCTGCGSCLGACPFGVIEIIDDKAVIGGGCTLCGACSEVCEFEALVMEEEEAAAPASDEYNGIWVFAEQRDGIIRSVAYELLSKGRELADTLNTELSAICLGHNVSEVEQLISYGADKVFLVDDPVLGDHQEDLYVGQLVRLIKEHKPEIVLTGATSMGRSFIPRVAAILETGLTADCTDLAIDTEKGLLLQTRPAFGGNVMATILCQTRRPQMSTVRPRIFPKQTLAGRQGQIIKVDFDKESITSRTKLINFIEDLSERIKIEDADIIVSGGRGLEKPENFDVIRELAAVMGAAVGSSRPPVDDGWIPYSHQVGQTGKTVRPKLYVACGISGSVQHMAGMQTAECIVAINSDPNAPIFEIATYGIVGDLFKIVPMLTEKLKG